MLGFVIIIHQIIATCSYKVLFTDYAFFVCFREEFLFKNIACMILQEIQKTSTCFSVIKHIIPGAK
jgi:hypothetical protein